MEFSVLIYQHKIPKPVEVQTIVSGLYNYIIITIWSYFVFRPQGLGLNPSPCGATDNSAILIPNGMCNH